MADAIGSIFQNTTSTAKTSKGIFDQNAEMYLGLFLTQLKNQDPTQPFDTAQMTEQLASLSNAQQSITMNKNLEELIALQKSSQASSLASFINKEVEYLGDTFYVEQGNTPQKFAYFVDAEYESVSVEIRDAGGVMVKKYPVEGVEVNGAQGSHDFTWDGTDLYGNPVEPGTYKVSVVAKNSNGQYGALTTFLKGVVTGVDFASAANPVIFIGNDDNRIGVDLSRVSAVLNPTTTLPTTPPPATGGDNNDNNA